jgi:hypothetical protein
LESIHDLFYLGFDKLLKLELLVSSNVGWLLNMCLYLGFNNLLELELLVFSSVEWLLDLKKNLVPSISNFTYGRSLLGQLFLNQKLVNVCKGFLA